MIQQLSNRFQKIIASLLLTVFYVSFLFTAAYGTGKSLRNDLSVTSHLSFSTYRSNFKEPVKHENENERKTVPIADKKTEHKISLHASVKTAIGGPSQPEMASFKAAGTDNLVNLFTGDFNYNIPLMDVGGYPVNIFYNGGISMEQEASWVGLGWNINPGNINRNMRGVPDDFNGEDLLVQTQMIKKNRTLGLNGGFDIELVGINGNPFSGSAGASLGISLNNYLGPAMEIGLKGSTSLTIAGKAKGEKSASGLQVGGSLGITASSRSGVTFSPSASLSAYASGQSNNATLGIGASTSYNSRVGIKALQISEQMSFNSLEGINKKALGLSMPLYSTSISFAKPSYIPSIRFPVTNSAFAARFEWGAGVFGVKGSSEYELFKQVSEIAPNDMVQRKPLVGFLYLQNAKNNPNAVVDFTRFNDNEITEKTPIISVPQYTYDVFSIQGEGTGGSIRAYRNDNGYVRDNFTSSRDNSFNVGADIAPPGHYGGNGSIIKTPTTVGEWNEGNKLRTSVGFTNAEGLGENVYFRNPGETSVLNEHQNDNIGGTDLVRFKLGGTDISPTIEPKLEKFSKLGELTGTVPHFSSITDRKKRTQVISFFNAWEASKMGLDKKIRSYSTDNILINGKLNYEEIDRVDDRDQMGNTKALDAAHFKRHHHISQINVTEANGQRYVYGIPVYNIKQKDFTFTTGGTQLADAGKDIVAFNPGEPYTSSSQLNTSASKDGYVQTTETPAFAHSFLLSGLLSQDYVDVGNDGITEDDLGSAVKFNYTRIKNSDGSLAVSRWRTPLSTGFNANFNAGKRTEIRDDKGLISCGERESWYMHSIESKTMIALFTLEGRADSKGAGANNTAMDIRTPADELSGINTSDNSAKRLKQIDLYNKSDLKKNGLANAKPIKTVHFEYSYQLCAAYPANSNIEEKFPPLTGPDINLRHGKLTLERIYFTYNGQNKANRSQYVFDYGTQGEQSGNPVYKLNASDRWGTYKPVAAEGANQPVFTQTQRNVDYPYSYQAAYSPTANLSVAELAKKTAINNYASAWMLKKILLPSGGQMEVQYESDDYAYVQDKHAATMMELDGLGNTSDYTKKGNHLFDVSSLGKFTENNYAFIKVPDTCANAAEVKAKYLQGMSQLAFKLLVQMPKGSEYLTSYANISIDKSGDENNYGIVATNPNIIWIKLETVDGLSPLSLTAVEFLREQLPGQAVDYSDVSDQTTLLQAVNLFIGMFASLGHAFSDPVAVIRGDNKSQLLDLSKCYVRLNDPDGHKYGGGYRVKSVRLKDNWQQMTGQYTSEYGQDYNYETTEIFNGAERPISSGVASYEPAMGAEENPFQTMYQVKNTVPLGPASYGSIVMPVVDAFFQSPIVGYSKVTVTSLKKGTSTQKSKSGIGKQVSEFFTAKDYPVYYSYTSLDPSADKKINSSSFGSFFWKFAFDSRAVSQGFLVATNDMHGKMKSQASYPENDDKTPVNYTRNFYKNTGESDLPEIFPFVYSAEGGVIKNGNMGIDVELMTDTREFSVKSVSKEVQGQLNSFPIFGLGPWFPFIWPVKSKSENTYRAVTTTKVVNYHAILDKVVVIDKGSEVSTQNLLYDAETGQVVVNQTNNEFKKAIFNTTYPAYWAYSGMGPAYKNIDAVYPNINLSDGKIINLPEQNSIFESGDEILLTAKGGGQPGCVNESLPEVIRLWAFDKNKDVSSLTNPTPEYYFMDSIGRLYTKTGVSLRIVRSGKRNMLGANAASVTSMATPIIGNKIVINVDSKAITAGAVEFKEKWQTDNNVFKTYKLIPDPNNTCNNIEVIDCAGYLEKQINPYVKGLLGTFRTGQSKVFYENRKETVPLVKTNISSNGYLNNFKLYWDFNTTTNLFVPDIVNTSWVWNSQITKINSKGLELETKNALNIYTAAQYGFNNTVPVAVVNNSRYSEMFDEGFEDDLYDETLNAVVANSCLKKHIDFTGLTNSTVINSDETTFAAHTGKKMLKVNGNPEGITQAVKQLTTAIGDNLDYDLKFGTATTKSLGDQGAESRLVPAAESGFYFLPPNVYFPGKAKIELTLDYSLQRRIPPYNFVNSYIYRSDFSFYIKISVKKDYKFNMYLQGEPARNQFSGFSNTISATITNLNNQSQGTVFLNQGQFSANIVSGFQTLQLCPGIYKIEGFTQEIYQNAPNPTDGYHTYSLECEGCDSYTYKSIVDICPYSVPIPGNQNMINPLFTLPTGKKMHFSAWVHEICTANCPPNSFDKSNIEIWNNGAKLSIDNSHIVHTGAIIDGWQKVEGDFTLPADATTPEIRFINSNTAPMYVDDIRVHPFNANMKSYVYDPVSLRLTSELDENNYAKFYEYNEEGTLARTKAETKEGIKTITETRSATQKNIKTFQ